VVGPDLPRHLLREVEAGSERRSIYLVLFRQDRQGRGRGRDREYRLRRGLCRYREGVDVTYARREWERKRKMLFGCLFHEAQGGRDGVRVRRIEVPTCSRRNQSFSSIVRPQRPVNNAQPLPVFPLLGTPCAAAAVVAAVDAAAAAVSAFTAAVVAAFAAAVVAAFAAAFAAAVAAAAVVVVVAAVV
jgi:hypothetical protein